MRLAVARLGWFALCLLPLSVGLGRFWHLYIAPGEGIAYGYRSIALAPADALVLLTCIGWLALRSRSDAPWRLPAASRLVFAALGLLVVASAASVAPAFDRLLAAGVTVQLCLLLVFFVAASELLHDFPRRELIIGIALAVIGQSVLAAWQAAAQTTAPAGSLFNGWASEVTAHDEGAGVVMLPIVGRWLRSYGSFPHPNILGGFLALTLAVLLPPPFAGEGPRGGLNRWRVPVLAMGLTALLLTFSRAAWLAVVFGALTWLLLARGRRITLASVRTRLAVASVMAIVVLFAVARVGTLGSLVERNSIDTRLFYNSVAWDVVARGVPVGAGNLVIAQQHLLGASAAGSEPAHNVLLIALAELGLLGLVAWLALFSSLLAAAWWRRTDAGSRAGPLIALTVMAPLMLLDHYLWTQSTGRVLVVFSLALLMSPGTAQRGAELRLAATLDESRSSHLPKTGQIAYL